MRPQKTKPPNQQNNRNIPSWILQLFREGIKAVPETKFTLGGIVFAVVGFAIFTLFFGRIPLAILGTFIGFSLAVLTVLFTQLVKVNREYFLPPVLALIWSITILTILFGAFSLTSFFYRLPYNKIRIFNYFCPYS